VGEAFLENPQFGYKVEYIDGDQSNARASNLRWKPLTNGATRLKHKNNTSGVNGVSFHKASQKWRAKITVNKKTVYCGQFENKDDAIKARQDAELLHFGEFRAV